MRTDPENWTSSLFFNPLGPLRRSQDPAIQYFTRRDLLNETVEDITYLWELRPVLKILRKQLYDGSWRYPGQRVSWNEDYDQVETYRQFAILVEKYGLDLRHPSVQICAEYFFSRQSSEGDFRGIYGNQYATTYSPAILELLVKAGYAAHPHCEKSFQWLLDLRQADGGWTIPLCTLGLSWQEAIKNPLPLQPDRSKPFSHLATGNVLRAFAAHPTWRSSPAARQAGELLTGRFFKPDRYPGRQSKTFWEKTSFPFWFTDLISALDSLSQLGFNTETPAIRQALGWLVERQQPDGSFRLKLIRSNRDPETPAWVHLAVCRIFKAYSI